MRKKTTFFAVSTFRMLIAAASTMSMLFGGAHNDASANQSPLLVQSPSGISNSQTLARTILQAGGGELNSDNATRVIQFVLKLNPDITPAHLATALNSLNLPDTTIKRAIDGATAIYGSDQVMVQALIADTYMNAGRSAAQGQSAILSGFFGNVATAENNRLAFLNDASDEVVLTPIADGTVYDG